MNRKGDSDLPFLSERREQSYLWHYRFAIGVGGVGFRGCCGSGRRDRRLRRKRSNSRSYRRNRDSRGDRARRDRNGGDARFRRRRRYRRRHDPGSNGYVNGAGRKRSGEILRRGGRRRSFVELNMRFFMVLEELVGVERRNFRDGSEHVPQCRTGARCGWHWTLGAGRLDNKTWRYFIL